MTVSSLDVELDAARKRVASVAPDLAVLTFENDSSEVAGWLDAAAVAASNRQFVLADDAQPETLYLWMNDFKFNLDRWFLTAFANGPAREPRNEFDWRDALIGDEIGSGLRVPDLTLRGMENVQEWFRAPADDSLATAVEELVLLSAFNLVAGNLPQTSQVPYRVAMSRSEEWRVCRWGSSGAPAYVHTWERSSP
ncbi:MAG: hypothetical protein JWL77_6995 [Chthonomonadaceae bacterium]|nr:hypothetical protein [Chthonomonadaceae bacterium]